MNIGDLTRTGLEADGNPPVLRCIACGSTEWRIRETWRAYQLALCTECGVTFTVNPDYRQDRYIAAYHGATADAPVLEEDVHVYRAPETRLRLETAAFPRLVPPPRLTPAERLALEWLKAHAPRGCAIVDCGCGTGRFLRSLTQARFRAVGVEVSEPLILLLRASRYDAVLGAAPDFAWQDSDPFAVTFFEVLEHFADPREILGPLHRRFPDSSILASVPSPQRASLMLKARQTSADYPPNHYVRWTPVGLSRFFESLGYGSVRVLMPPPVGSEMVDGLGTKLLGGRGSFAARKRAEGVEPPEQPTRPPASRRRFEATLALWALKGYQVAADIAGFPWAARARRLGASAGSLLVIAQP